MKNILGLDLGSNSIGWAIVKALKNEDGKEILQSIDLAGSRIIPMDQATLGNFENGNSVSQTRERTGYRSARRLRERYLLRRERLLRVLNCMGFLPEHYSQNIDKYPCKKSMIPCLTLKFHVFDACTYRYSSWNIQSFSCD